MWKTMYMVEGWMLRMWLFLIPTTHMHTCTPLRHQQWLPNSQAPEVRSTCDYSKSQRRSWASHQGRHGAQGSVLNDAGALSPSWRYRCKRARNPQVCWERLGDPQNKEQMTLFESQSSWQLANEQDNVFTSFNHHHHSTQHMTIPTLRMIWD